MVDAAGANVPDGPTWPLSLPYVAGSNGNYEAVASGMTVSAFDRYTARITIDTGGGVIKAIEHPLMALMAHE